MSLPTDVTVTGRISYPHLFEPHLFDSEKDQGKEPQFKCELYVDPTNDREIDAVQAIVGQIVAAELQGQMPTNPDDLPLKPAPANNENVAGKFYVMRPKSRQRPQVYQLDAAGGYQPVLDPNLIQDGDYVAVSMRLYKFENSGKRGVASALNSVLYLGQGPGRLGKSGGPAAEVAFAAISMPPGLQQPQMHQPIHPGVPGAPQPQAPQPQYPQPQAPQPQYPPQPQQAPQQAPQPQYPPMPQPGQPPYPPQQ